MIVRLLQQTPTAVKIAPLSDVACKAKADDGNNTGRSFFSNASKRVVEKITTVGGKFNIISAMNDLTEKTLAAERMYTGKIISVDLLDVELPDGRRAKREVIRHGAAVAILARRPDGRFVFVKQYRKAAEAALVEVIAGGLEEGEDPVEGAKRETAEETGYEVTSIKFLTTIICTPGYCEERIHLYFAELSATAHGQDQDPDENVHPVIMSESEVEAGIRNGTIFDAKTIAAWACYRLQTA